MRGILRRLRGAIGNAVVWAGSWFVGAFGLAATLYAVVDLPMPFWTFTLGVAQNVAAMGFLTGGAFSLYLGIAGRRKTLAELRPVRFGVWGGLIAGLLVPGTYLAMNLAVGVPLSLMTPSLIAAAGVSALFGSVTAYATIRIAQSAPAELTGGEVMSQIEARGD